MKKTKKYLKRNIYRLFSFGIIMIIVIGAVISYVATSSHALTDEEMRNMYDKIEQGEMTGSCGALGHTTEEYLTGSCCGKMRFERYKTQRTFLEQYANNKMIPPDPWNVSVALAQKLTEYNSLELTPEEQHEYDKAWELFDEGPCCCKCWRWHTFNGLAKYLIKNEGFSGKQIAELWAAEDVCGDEDPFEEFEDDTS